MKDTKGDLAEIAPKQVEWLRRYASQLDRDHEYTSARQFFALADSVEDMLGILKRLTQPKPTEATLEDGVNEREAVILEIQAEARKRGVGGINRSTIRQILETISENKTALDYLARFDERD